MENGSSGFFSSKTMRTIGIYKSGHGAKDLRKLWLQPSSKF
jgi:hypothetical protein